MFCVDISDLFNQDKGNKLFIVRKLHVNEIIDHGNELLRFKVLQFEIHKDI